MSPPQINTSGHSDILSVLEDDGRSSQYEGKVRHYLWLCWVSETECRDLRSMSVVFFQNFFPRTGRNLSNAPALLIWFGQLMDYIETIDVQIHHRNSIVPAKQIFSKPFKYVDFQFKRGLCEREL